MRMKLFVVRDMKAGISNPRLACAESSVEALRNFELLCKDPKGPFVSHPDDFVLFEVGEFDRETGLVVGHNVAVPLASPRDFLSVASASVGSVSQVS